MNYSFDVQGTLLVGDNTQIRREIVSILESLRHDGHTIIVNSSAAMAQKDQPYSYDYVAMLMKQFNIYEYINAIHIAYFENLPEEGHVYRAGLSKAQIMRELNIDLHFDDLPEICRAIRDQGLKVVQV